MVGSRGGSGPPGSPSAPSTSVPGARATYTLDPNPNDIYGSWAAQVAGDWSPVARTRSTPCWPARNGRCRSGRGGGRGSGAVHGRSRCAPPRRSAAWVRAEQARVHRRPWQHPGALVQGPPGTGKSYSTAFALFARRERWRPTRTSAPSSPARPMRRPTSSWRTWSRCGDAARVRRLAARDLRLFRSALLDVPCSASVRAASPAGVIALPKDNEREAGTPKAIEFLEASRWCVVAAPGGTYGMIKERWPKELFGHHLADCLVLDEASQMNLPEAVMAALPLAGRPAGGRRRPSQMPPIVKHDWASEPRRTFQEFRSYESLFAALCLDANGEIRGELPSPRRHGGVPAAGGLRAGRDQVPLQSARGARGPPGRRRLSGRGAGAGAPAGGRRPRRSREPGAQPVRATVDRPILELLTGRSRGLRLDVGGLGWWCRTGRSGRICRFQP